MSGNFVLHVCYISFSSCRMEFSGNNEVSSTVMRKMGICYKIAKLMQTDGRSCLLERGLTNTDKHRKAVALRNLIQELTVLTGQHFTEKQITKCLSNMRNRLKERMSLTATTHGERLGGWERELLTVYKQGGLMNGKHVGILVCFPSSRISPDFCIFPDLKTDDAPTKGRRGSRHNNGSWKHASPNGLPTQVQRMATLSSVTRSSSRSASQHSRNCVPIGNLRISVPKVTISRVLVPKAAKRASTRTPESRGANSTSDSVRRTSHTNEAPHCGLRKAAANVTVTDLRLPSGKRRGYQPPVGEDDVTGSIETPVDVRAVIDDLGNHNDVETDASEGEIEQKIRLPGRDVSEAEYRRVARNLPDESDEPNEGTTNHTGSSSEQQVCDDAATATHTSVATSSHFEFETDETSRLSNEQLHRLVMLEQLAYVRLKRNLLAQRILADTSQRFLDDRALDEATTNGC